MNPFTGAGAAAQTAHFPITVTVTETIPRTITPVCHSPYYHCPPHSLLPYYCPSHYILCPPSPPAVCHVSPLPFCAQPVSPTCQPTYPTTIPTTIQTASPVVQPQAAAAQAAPQAAAQAFTFGGPTFTIPYSVIGCHPSPFVFCPPHSVFVACTIPHSLLCSPTPVCVATPGHTTIPTATETGTFAAQAAPQAAAHLATAGATVTHHFSNNVHCISPLQGCFPSEILWQCHPSYPIHCPLTPGNTYTYPQTVTRTIGTYGTYGF